MKALVIINTFGLITVPQHLHNCLSSWWSQELGKDDLLDIVIVDCCSDATVVRTYLTNFCSKNSTKQKHFHFLPIDEKVTLLVSTNVGILKFKDRERYDFFIYCVEDCCMTQKNDLLTLLSDWDSSIGLLSAMVTVDNTDWYPHYNVIDWANKEIAIGESINLAFGAYSKEFMERYNYRVTDVLVCYGYEGLLTFMNAAINKKWVHSNKVLFHHLRWQYRKDAVKSYSLGLNHQGHGYPYHGILGEFTTIPAIMAGGHDVGLGYECCQNWYPYNKELYDGNKCICADRLYEYIKQHLFLPPETFDYNRLLKGS